MPMDDPLEQLRATLEGPIDTDATGPRKEELRRIVRRALRPGCPPSSLTRWIRTKAADVMVDTSSEEQFNLLIDKVAAEITEQLGPRQKE